VDRPSHASNAHRTFRKVQTSSFGDILSDILLLSAIGGGVTLRLRQASPLENPSYVVLCTDKGRITRLQDTILERYRRYGPIYRETIAGETVVHLLKPDYIQTVYQNEGKIPYLVPLLETTQMYRRLRQMSPGLGNTYVILYY